MTPSRLPRRRFLRNAAGLAGLGALQGCGIFRGSAVIPVGILHSLSGTMSISESPLRDAEIMAIEEINRAGGLLGRRVTAQVMDGSSNPARFAAQAEELLTQPQPVCSVFGGWTSTSRKAMLPVFARYGGLLWYPVQYEGEECAAQVIYGGATPNQQVVPGLDWLLRQGRRRIFLAGSDYIFPRTANAILRGHLARQGGTVTSEAYVPLGGHDFTAMAAAIRRDAPEAIFSTINGDSNVYFFRELARSGLTPERTPVMMASVAECEVRLIGADVTAGHYACWNYFQSLNTPANQSFVERFRARYGPFRVVDDPIESAYSQVHLWAEAVRRAQATDAASIRRAAAGCSFNSPGGTIHIDPHNQHTWKPVHIGRINADGQFDIVESSPGLVAPQPWDQTLNPGEVCRLD